MTATPIFDKRLAASSSERRIFNGGSRSVGTFFQSASTTYAVDLHIQAGKIDDKIDYAVSLAGKMHKAFISPKDCLRCSRCNAAEETAIVEPNICQGCGDCLTNCSAKAVVLKNS